MPHSSGGGSHGGGFHGGGSHHSGGRIGNTGNPAKIRTSHFSGASRYVYYRNNRPNYIYSNYDLTRKPSKAVIASYIISAAIILFFLLYLFSLIFLSTLPIHGAKGDIQIDDRIDVLSSSEASNLQDALEQFKEKTGIPAYFLAITNETWKKDYTTLEKYAYDFYLDTQPDEKSWLLVYSQPEIYEPGSINWYWEGMQGNDTDRVLTSSITRNFNKTLYLLLSDSKEFNVGNSFTEAFRTITPLTLKRNLKGIAPIIWFYLLLLLAFGIWMLYTAIHRIQIYKKYKDYQKCPTAKMFREVTCSFCKGVYVEGTVKACPHCGTAIH